MSRIFARNFDYEAEAAAMEPDAEAEPTGPVMLTQAEAEQMVAEARTVAFEEGLTVGASRALAEERAGREARSDEALAVLAQKMSDLDTRDQIIRTEVELELANLVVGIGERILPDLFDSHITDLLLARARTAMGMVSGDGLVLIRIPPELQDTLAPRLQALVSRLSPMRVKVEIVADPEIDDGTLCVEWRNGFLKYDPAVASFEALETLREAIDDLKPSLESMP